MTKRQRPRHDRSLVELAGVGLAFCRAVSAPATPLEHFANGGTVSGTTTSASPMIVQKVFPLTVHNTGRPTTVEALTAEALSVVG